MVPSIHKIINDIHTMSRIDKGRRGIGSTHRRQQWSDPGIHYRRGDRCGGA